MWARPEISRGLKRLQNPTVLAAFAQLTNRKRLPRTSEAESFWCPLLELPNASRNNWYRNMQMFNSWFHAVWRQCISAMHAAQPFAIVRISCCCSAAYAVHVLRFAHRQSAALPCMELWLWRIIIHICNCIAGNCRKRETPGGPLA